MVGTFLDRCPPAWLVDAEISVPCGSPGPPALSLFFERSDPFDAFAEAHPHGALLQAHERAVRERFLLVPRRWVKLGVGLSQYFQVDPTLAYPLTTLRVFLRHYGVPDVRSVAALLEPALASTDAIWCLILKHGGIAAVPRIACRIPRSTAAVQVAHLATRGFLGADVADAYLALLTRMPGGKDAIVSIEPHRAGHIAVDFENVPTEAVPGAAAIAPGLARLSYAKCRLATDGAAAWTAYLPLPEWRRSMTGAPPGSSRFPAWTA